MREIFATAICTVLLAAPTMTACRRPSSPKDVPTAAVRTQISNDSSSSAAAQLDLPSRDGPREGAETVIEETVLTSVQLQGKQLRIVAPRTVRTALTDERFATQSLSTERF